MSAFDPNTFLEAQLTTPTEKRPPLPIENPDSEDGLYTALVGEVKARAWQGRKDPTKSGIAWDIPLVVQVGPKVQATLKYNPEFTLTDSVMLDITEQGTIDQTPGRNRRLRDYREATNMNKPGDVFSAKKMQGAVVKVKIAHEMYNDAPIEKVSSVLKS